MVEAPERVVLASAAWPVGLASLRLVSLLAPLEALLIPVLSPVEQVAQEGPPVRAGERCAGQRARAWSR